MINYYPRWKYWTIFVVFMTGCVYAIPSLYNENYVVFINSYMPDQECFDVLLPDISKILINNNIKNKRIDCQKNNIYIYFYSESDQLYAYKILSHLLSKECSIFIQKTSSVPNWLCRIFAKPIQLGLDLKGGLYLIVRINVEIIFRRLQEQYIELLQSSLFEKQIFYKKIYKIENYGIKIVFKDFNDKNQAILYLFKLYPNLMFRSVDTDILSIFFSKDYMNSIYKDVVQQNSIIIRNRMTNQLKIIDPVVQRLGLDSIMIELPGIQDIDRVKMVLSNTANLEFRLVNTTINQFKIHDNMIPVDSEIKLDESGNIVPLYKKVVLTGDHIIDSHVNLDKYHRPQVNIFLDKLGSVIISKFTQDNIGKPIATLFVEYKDSGEIDFQGNRIFHRSDKVINIAIIQSRLAHCFSITGIKNIHDAQKLSSLLKIGTLTAPIYIQEERMIGPMLGKKNITEGIIACGLSVLTSICFMIFWYRYFGLIAGVALISNLIFMISLISLIPGIVLTMPGIAGIVLTLSVAIDSNVLINERIKEEIKHGKPIQYSIYTGYRRALMSIVDANITTLITSIILSIISTGAIQGFAIITIIGVVTSMFTSIIETRAIINLIYGKKQIDTLSI